VQRSQLFEGKWVKEVVVKSQIERIVGWVVEIPSAAVIDLCNHMAHAMWLIHEVDVTPFMPWLAASARRVPVNVPQAPTRCWIVASGLPSPSMPTLN